MYDVIGYIGGALLVLNFTPQIYKTYKTKKMKDVSLIFIIFNIITCCFQTTYGILIDATPLIIANSIVFFELLILLYAKLVFKEDIHKINPMQISEI